jgi:hypothetical protein
MPDAARAPSSSSLSRTVHAPHLLWPRADRSSLSAAQSLRPAIVSTPVRDRWREAALAPTYLHSLHLRRLQGCTQQQMIDPRPGIGLPFIAKIIPESKHCEPGGIQPGPDLASTDRQGHRCTRRLGYHRSRHLIIAQVVYEDFAASQFLTHVNDAAMRTVCGHLRADTAWQIPCRLPCRCCPAKP